MKKIIIRWPLGYLFLWVLFIACKQQPEPVVNTDHYHRQIDSLKKMAQNGDLIFRNGTDEVSRAARSFNRLDTSFSHCGLVLVEQDTPFVYHAIGGNYNPGQRLKRELLDSFCTPADNDRVGLYRYAMSTTENDSLQQIIRNYYKAGLRFDLFFNFFSDDEMYCSEFVFKSLNRSLGGRLTKYLQKEKWPYGIALDDLFRNENARLVKRAELSAH